MITLQLFIFLVSCWWVRGALQGINRTERGVLQDISWQHIHR